MQFTLPVQANAMEVQSLLVRLEGQASGRRASAARGIGFLSFFDWRAASWRDWEAHFGETRVDLPARFISAGGDIRVRYTLDPPSGSSINQIRLSRFDLTGRVRAL
jgi:hypothetical protein